MSYSSFKKTWPGEKFYTETYSPLCGSSVNKVRGYLLNSNVVANELLSINPLRIGKIGYGDNQFTTFKRDATDGELSEFNSKLKEVIDINNEWIDGSNNKLIYIYGVTTGDIVKGDPNRTLHWEREDNDPVGITISEYEECTHMKKCPKCGMVEACQKHSYHNDVFCIDRQSRAEARESDMKSTVYQDEAVAIIRSGIPCIPMAKRLAVKVNTRIEELIELYRKNDGFSGLSLTEFLKKGYYEKG